ncbi:GGDEF domain-containing protein [Actinoplanes sp. M2I2]|uniref:GGDEF domain-containing protein n=1 Tax=Actinoplanes sp. M2I2 TaxID=1734444 RepID=UPI0020207705|nr:GGDEF domain-containing protein [Actinoplanes sp. M2I2]
MRVIGTGVAVRRWSVGLAVLLSLLMVGGAGFYLADTTSGARAEVLHEFQARSESAAGVISGTLAVSDRQLREAGQGLFAGTPAQLGRQNGRKILDTPWYAVLSGDGAVLVADPVSYEPLVRSLASSAGFVDARRTGKLSFGDLLIADNAKDVPAFQPFEAPDGPRMLVMPVGSGDISTLATGALGATSAWYLLDQADGVVAARDASAAGSPLADAALRTALDARANGAVGDRYFASHQAAGTTWRVVLTTSRSELLAPVQQTGRVAWQLFAAFAAAMIVILTMGLLALGGSARLARERLHDTLTGLPNRALFLERAEAAIADWRRKRQAGGEGAVAALFLDLDGFKPVNDTYGHAAGDALLKQVALRLIDATRPDDYVSRFGGDEFLVLCRKLREGDDVLAVADRIQQYLSEPYEVDGRTVTIGVSIGIATLDESAQEAEALIRNADAALYCAKEDGRGRVALFSPERHAATSR